MGFDPLKALRNVFRFAQGKDPDVAIANPTPFVNPVDFTSPGGTTPFNTGGVILAPPTPAPAPVAPTPAPVAATAVAAPTVTAPTPTMSPAVPSPSNPETAAKLDSAARAERIPAGKKKTLLTGGGYTGLVEGSAELSGETKKKRPRTLLA